MNIKFVTSTKFYINTSLNCIPVSDKDGRFKETIALHYHELLQDPPLNLPLLLEHYKG